MLSNAEADCGLCNSFILSSNIFNARAFRRSCRSSTGAVFALTATEPAVEGSLVLEEQADAGPDADDSIT